MRRLVYYVAVSADGFIADAYGDVSAFPVEPATLAELFALYPETCPVHARGALGVTAGPTRFDTVIMGYRTHAPALDAGLSSAYPHLRQLVVTHRDLPADDTVEVVTGDVRGRVAQLKAEPGRDIWLCGGADVAGQLVDEIDEFQLKVNPVLFGHGIPLIGGDAGMPTGLHLIESRVLPGGVVFTTYRR